MTFACNANCGIRWIKYCGWEVWTDTLSSPIRCTSAAEAKRIAQSIAASFALDKHVDYSEADLAIARAKAFATRRQRFTS